MSPREHERIAALGRERGAELAHTVAGKSATLRTLGWPDALTARQNRKAA